MKVYICNYDYWENEIGPVLRVMCREVNNDKHRIILDIQDERIAPVMYILETDFDIVKETCEEFNIWNLVTRFAPSIETEYKEPSIALYTKYPRDVRKIRDNLTGIMTFQSDVVWEKKVVQQLKWKLVLDIKDYDELSFTPLDNITPSDEIVKTNFNICYWDIETDSSQTKGKEFSDCRFAPRIPIISYVTFSRHEKYFIYYGWMEKWKNEVYWGEHETELGEKALGMEMFKNYNCTPRLLIKKFSNEREMHRTFISDFQKGEYDGLMTFNGRGGNRVINKKGKQMRQWFTGFDFPMFYERCSYLGLSKEIQKMSPIPIGRNFFGEISSPSVKMRLRKDENDIETGREYVIKCIPQHDLFYDNNVLMYTTNHDKMKRRNLETFLNYFLGFGKIKHKESVCELFYKNPEKEMRYNIVDVEGMYALDLYFGYTDDVALRALAYGGKIEDGVYASKLHDHIKLWKISGQYLLPSRPEFGAIMARENQWRGLQHGKVGGLNIETVPGIYGYTDDRIGFILDFGKLYPSCSRSINADTRSKINLKNIIVDERGIVYVDNSGDQFLWDNVTRNPAGFFRKDVISIDTIIYDELISMRSKLKKEMVRYYSLANDETDPVLKENYLNMGKTYDAMQFSYKGLINGKFGSSGMEGSRSFDYVVYNTPPATGQLMLLKTISIMEEYGYPAKFGSTDSVMSIAKSTDPHEAWKEIQVLVRIINDILDVWQKEQFNIIKNYNSISCEKIFRPWILFNKRYYACSVIMNEDGGKIIEYNEPKLYWKGMAKVRRNTSDFTYNLEDTIINMIFRREDSEVIFQYIRELNNGFENNNWEYVCEKCGISKSVDESTSQNYIACRNANTYLNKNYDAGATPYLGIFSRGGYPRFINNKLVKSEKDTGEFIIAFDENDEWELRKMGFKLDYNTYKYKVFIKKIEPLLKLVFNKTFSEVIIDKDSLWEV